MWFVPDRGRHPANSQYPCGSLRVLPHSFQATYTIKPGQQAGTGELLTEFEAKLAGAAGSGCASVSCPINLTNHAYWNLSGSCGRTVRGHLMQLGCDRFLPLDENSVSLPGRRVHAQGSRVLSMICVILWFCFHFYFALLYYFFIICNNLFRVYLFICEFVSFLCLLIYLSIFLCWLVYLLINLFICISSFIFVLQGSKSWHAESLTGVIKFK